MREDPVSWSSWNSKEPVAHTILHDSICSSYHLTPFPPPLRMVSYDLPFGYSLRVNGSCPERTKQCRATWDGFVACCPSESTCKVSDNNKNPICCPNEADCREPLFRIAHCANASWTMYEHYDLFCCKEEDQGFWTSEKKYNNIVGRAKQPEGASRTILNPIAQSTSLEISCLGRKLW